MYLARKYLHNMATNILKSDANFYTDRMSDNISTCTSRVELCQVVAILHCFRFRGKICFFPCFLAILFRNDWRVNYKRGGNRRIPGGIPIYCIPRYRCEALNTLVFRLMHFHPFGPRAGTNVHGAFGDDEVSPSGHPELLFKLLLLLPKVQLTIVSCVPSKSCSSSSSSSSSSSCWLFEAELPLLLYCNHENHGLIINKQNGAIVHKMIKLVTIPEGSP